MSYLISEKPNQPDIYQFLLPVLRKEIMLERKLNEINNNCLDKNNECAMLCDLYNADGSCKEATLEIFIF